MTQNGQPVAALVSMDFLQRSYGPARAISFGPAGGVVIARRSNDLANWKRYRGGTAGEIWLDPTGAGDFRPLLSSLNHVVAPLWLGERVYFLSDHEGIGNLYSCNLAGEDIQRHTHHEDFYARNPSSDGRRLVYRAGGDLFIFDPIRPKSVPVFDPISSLVFSSGADNVTTTIIAGQVVMEEGRILTIDEPEMLRECQKKAWELAQRAGYAPTCFAGSQRGFPPADGQLF